MQQAKTQSSASMIKYQTSKLLWLFMLLSHIITLLVPVFLVPFLSSPALSQTQAERKTEADRLMQQGDLHAAEGQCELAINNFEQAWAIYQDIQDQQGERRAIEQIQICIPEFSGKGTPLGKREDAGSRDGCSGSLTALVPPNGAGLTVSGYPTFFFSLPQNSNTNKVADFLLTDENQGLVYRTRIQLPQTSGIIGLAIPATADISELQIGKRYKWTFAIICNAQDRGQDLYVYGNVKRVVLPNLADALNAVSAREYPFVYAHKGVWYDALASLAELRRKQPNDAKLVDDWVRLLRLVELEKVANDPLIIQ